MRVIVGWIFVLALPCAAGAQPSTAFQNVSVIPMDRERVETGQTVLVQGDRIVAIGRASEVAIPGGATVVDGAGRYLLPGLTDAHVHLESWQGIRQDFGDAPLYLAHGVTTVVNLRGTPTFVEWRRRVQSGELTGPTIYTAGEFLIGPGGPTLSRDSGELVVGPNVTTPEDVEREVAAQVRQGVDVIKFYGGLDLPAYLKMAETARAAGIPLVGHGPNNLGMDALLQTRQSLAHTHMLFALHFFPMFSNFGILLMNMVALLILAVVAIMSGAIALIKRRRTATLDPSPAMTRARVLTRRLLVIAVLTLVLQLDVFVWNRFTITTLLVVFIVLAGCVAMITAALVVATVKIWRETSASMPGRLQASVTTLAGLALTAALTLFWVPAMWHYTDRGIARVASRLHDAGIAVQTTLVAFDVLASGPDKFKDKLNSPAFDYLAPEIRAGWRRLPLPEAPVVPEQIVDVIRRLTAALNRAGVLLVAGTDALGAPLIVPGVSIHDELQLLTQAGLTPYDAIRTATINPAIFLGKDKEFGTIAVGKRADLVLVEGNPLQDLTTLKQPLGVMVRGTWFTREELQRMLTALLGKG